MARAASDLLDGLADTLEQLRVAVKRGIMRSRDLAYVVQPRFEQRLRLDALDLQLNLAQVNLRADADFEQLPDLRSTATRASRSSTSISILSTLTTGMSARTSGLSSMSTSLGSSTE